MEEQWGRFIDGGKSVCSGGEDAEKVRWRQITAQASTERNNSRATKQWKEPPVGRVWTCGQSLNHARCFTILHQALRSLRAYLPHTNNYRVRSWEATQSLSLDYSVKPISISHRYLRRQPRSQRRSPFNYEARRVQQATWPSAQTVRWFVSQWPLKVMQPKAQMVQKVFFCQRVIKVRLDYYQWN